MHTEFRHYRRKPFSFSCPMCQAGLTTRPVRVGSVEMNELRLFYLLYKIRERLAMRGELTHLALVSKEGVKTQERYGKLYDSETQELIEDEEDIDKLY